MTKQIKSFYEASRYLGQYMPGKVPFLGEIACMGANRKVQIAVLKWVLELIPLLKEKGPEDLGEEEIIDTVLIPLLKKLGYAEWVTDTVTDMAIKKGIKTKTETWESPEEDQGENKE